MKAPDKKAIALMLVASLATLAVALGDSWRTALLALCASGLLAATRVRFAIYAAIGLLIVVALVALTGRTATSDDRRGTSAADVR